ncbi:MAG: hypothetical protein KA841_02055, partial [Chitinophagales bacterium]|nr:hypothetical protein [Chitinophagales bacterium]
MPITIEVKLSPEEAALPQEVKRLVSREAGIPEAEVLHIHYLRKSLDARKGRILFILKAEVYVTGEKVNIPLRTFEF